MKILITGSGGQLGRSLPSALFKHIVTMLPHKELDITRLDQVRDALRLYRPHLVINAAGFSDVDAAEVQKDHVFRVNLRGPENIALATAELGSACLHVSSSYVFDGAARLPYRESDQPNPLSVYGNSKLAGEHAVALANPRHYLVRTSWLYHESGNNFPNKVLSLGPNREIRVDRGQRSSPTYAPHLARGIADLIETEVYGVHHMAGTGSASRFELARALCSVLGLKAEVVPISEKECTQTATRPKYSVMTSRRETNIHLPEWEQGLSDFASLLRRAKAA